MTNTIYIVRHGQTEWNLLGKTQGHGNSDLTPKGIEQAELLADSMTKYPIDYIYSSDLGRAYQTAEIIGNKLNIEVEKTKALREMNFGTWEGRIIKDIIAEDPELYKMWRNEPHLAKIPQGETLSQIKERTDAFIKEINEKLNMQVTFNEIKSGRRVTKIEFIFTDFETNTALNIIELRDYGPVVMKMNDTTHIINDTKLENSALE